MKPTWRKVYRWPHEWVPAAMRIQPLPPPDPELAYNYVCTISRPSEITLRSETYTTRMTPNDFAIVMGYEAMRLCMGKRTYHFSADEVVDWIRKVNPTQTQTPEPSASPSIPADTAAPPAP